METRKCKRIIKEPNGVTLLVAQAIRGGDFQAEALCKGCNVQCEEEI